MRFILNGMLIAALLTIGLKAFDQPFISISQAQGPLPGKLQWISGDELEEKIAGNTGKTIVLFYTSWCPYCRKQMSIMHDLKQERVVRNILAVSVDNDPGQLADYVAEFPNYPATPFVYRFDRSLERVLEPYGIKFGEGQGIPYVVVLDGRQPIAQNQGMMEAKDIRKALNSNAPSQATQ